MPRATNREIIHTPSEAPIHRLTDVEMATSTTASPAGARELSVTSSPTPRKDELVLVYETYFKSFEWKPHREIEDLREKGETILSFSISPHSSTVWITVSWCLQNTYDDDDDDDGYNGGDCEEENFEGEEIELPDSQDKGMRRGDLKVLYVRKGH
ncbi:hypothetical protein DL98DRAFT_649911 [Cadophora sp. DSE1049]|nr:hypothetical protein DL98DRAFT_649911 [Cadophora sp. DSE1049]